MPAPGRSGPVHHHGHAVRDRARPAAPRRLGRRPPPSCAPAGRPRPGRSAVGAAPRVIVRSPTSSISTRTVDLGGHRPVRGRTPRCRARSVSSTGPSALRHLERLRSAPSRCAESPRAGPSSRTVPGTTAIARSTCPVSGRQAHDGAYRHDPLEGRVEIDRDRARLHVLHVDVDPARQLEVARVRAPSAPRPRRWCRAACE